MKIGIISDTHNFLEPKLGELFNGVDHILHAGDVGMPWILHQLEQIAPVTAVLGNTDSNINLREIEIRELGGITFLICHIVNPNSPAKQLGKRILQIQPDMVVFGHTHQVFDQTVNGTLFFNPGYAGEPKFAQSRSAAILHVGESEWTREIIPL